MIDLFWNTALEDEFGYRESDRRSVHFLAVMYGEAVVYVQNDPLGNRRRQMNVYPDFRYGGI